MTSSPPKYFHKLSLRMCRAVAHHFVRAADVAFEVGELVARSIS